MKLAMTNFSLKYPWVVIASAVILAVVMAAQFPKVKFDNDPENMLSASEPVRVFHHEVKSKFSLYDFVIVGIVNEDNPDGVFNVNTLGRIYDLTAELLSLHPNADGLPTVTRPGIGGRPAETRTIDLTPDSAWARGLNVAFRHDPNRLFDADGNSAIIGAELISPSVVDNIKQADLGSLKLEYLMEEPPTTREQALTIRNDAMRNPLYAGTLVSEDEKAICLYIPIKDKTYSYNVSKLVDRLTGTWDGPERVYMTGLPVAEDTFGVEMLVQMATSAPLAGVAIFLLLLLFFRRVSLIIAPMIVAILSVVGAMGLLIGRGHDVHIMSSMIAIFLMPIAVADAVHILSEFFDVYHRFNDKAKTVRHVIGHLFKPMLYTSMTTIAGFWSLSLTPIPPVSIFGSYVAFGVALAWVLTMTLIPAYIMVAVSPKSLHRLGGGENCELPHDGRLNRTMEWLGRFSYAHWKAILLITAVVLAFSVAGIVRIRVNDNPVKWFTRHHPIRVADEVLNRHFGGTYTAYLTLEPVGAEATGCREKAATIDREVVKRFGEQFPDATREFRDVLKQTAQLYNTAWSSDVEKCFVHMVEEATKIDDRILKSWNNLADAVNYLDPDGLTIDALRKAVTDAANVDAADRRLLLSRLEGVKALGGAELQNAALSICDEFTSKSFREFMFEMKAELTAPLFKRPEMLRYVEALQKHLLRNPVVGKTSSAVDALKKASYELSYVAPPADADEPTAVEYRERNDANFSIPHSVSAVAQVFTQLEGMKKKDSLFHLVTKDYREANVWVQLKSGDNRDMDDVVKDVAQFFEQHPPPEPAKVGWAGLTYLNVVWQAKMVKGMLSSLGSSFLVVLVMMIVLFRSPLFGLLSMIPLTVTISFIYGLIGHAGKDYDMPVAVLSALTLGLSVDFAIHFLERAREEYAKRGTWREACVIMFKEPAMAISRNAITISVGFTPLLVAPLVPYKTVGFFLATIMAVSWLATLFILPAFLTMWQARAFGKRDEEAAVIAEGAAPERAHAPARAVASHATHAAGEAAHKQSHAAAGGGDAQHHAHKVPRTEAGASEARHDVHKHAQPGKPASGKGKRKRK